MLGLSYIYSTLVGGLKHQFYDFPIILGISSSQLTFTRIFFRGVAKKTPTSIVWICNPFLCIFLLQSPISFTILSYQFQKDRVQWIIMNVHSLSVGVYFSMVVTLHLSTMFPPFSMLELQPGHPPLGPRRGIGTVMPKPHGECKFRHLTGEKWLLSGCDWPLFFDD